MICPRCQEVLKDNARFCSNCGLSFSSLKEGAGGLPDTLPETDPIVGKVLDGKYEVFARLGEGGMGAVYRARRAHIGDEVALKVLLRKFVADGELVERFRREARAAAALRHPNVVSIYDFGEARDADAPAYIVMELVEGEPLGRLLRREKRLTPERAVALMREICAGVGAAHRRQIFHRDLKPDNVIVIPPDEDRERETVKVVDFGLAKLRDAASAPTLTETGAIMGTPHYMSPEQCRGEQLDARSDVYSLGAMLYEMLAGVPPFTAPSVPSVLAKHITEPPPSLPADTRVPPALAAVLMRSLAKDPDARPSDATDFARELRAAEEETSGPYGDEAQHKQAKESKLRKHVPDAPTGVEQDVKPEVRSEISSTSIKTLVLPITRPRRSKRAAVFVAAVLLVMVGSALIVWRMLTPSENPSSALNAPQKITNSVGMEFVWMPSGSFLMGSENGDSDEKPVHQVTIGRGFFMGKYEVTQAQWQKVTGNNPSKLKGDNLPVDSISWDDALTFVARLNAQDSQYRYRLPTESEWEYAARAGTTGDYAGDLDATAWYDRNSGSKTHPVGTKTPNAFGLFDMQGNVWEWCQDLYHATYAGAPTDGSAWLGADDQKERVLRGGSWYNRADALRSASRIKSIPSNDDFNNGLRVVALPPPAEPE